MSERRPRSAAAVGLGAGIAALSGVIVMSIAARTLSTEQNSGFLTFWAGLFAVFAVLSGIQNEMTRAVRADLTFETDERRTSPLVTALLLGLGAAVIVLLLFPLWQSAFRGLEDRLLPMVLIAVAALLYAGHVATVGILGGRGAWGNFGALTAAESLVRLALAAAAALFGWGIAGFECAAAGGTITWLVVTLLLPGSRRVWAVRIGLRRGALVRRSIAAMASSGANALMVTGFPLLMSLTTDADAYATAAPLIVAVSMTRAPLLIPLTAFQSMVIAAFVTHPERARASLLRLIGAIVAVAVAGGALGALLGPWLMRLVFGAGYGSSPMVLGLLVVAAALLALLVLGGSVALALDAHALSAIGWYVALAVSVVIMLMPFELTVRTILALAIGPLAGSLIHLTSIMRILRAQRQEAD